MRGAERGAWIQSETIESSHSLAIALWVLKILNDIDVYEMVPVSDDHCTCRAITTACCEARREKYKTTNYR